MKKMSVNQWIAVGAGAGLVGFLFYGQGILSFLGFGSSEPASNDNIPTSGVEVRDIVVGSGAEAQAGDRLTVHYVGILSDGRVFDSSLDRNTPFIFTLGTGSVIRGWDEGIVGMKVGGRRQLFIAPDYAYGPNAAGTIPANSALIFEVELLDVEKSGGAPEAPSN